MSNTKKIRSRKLAATLFPIVGLSESRYRFRVLQVREKIPEDNLRPIRMQRWADYLWRNVLKCPIYPTSKYQGPTFLAPDGNTPNVGESIEIPGTPSRIYHVDVTDNILEVSLKNAEGSEKDLICRMLERAFTDRFRSLENVFWRSQWTSFFLLNQENEKVESDTVNAYRGLKFGVVLLKNSCPYLAVDIRTRYIGRLSLSQYSQADRKNTLQDHLDPQRVEDRASFIRDNGPIKISCRYTGETNLTIDKFKIPGQLKEETILQYYTRRYPWISLNPKDRAVYVQDKIEKGSIACPESRLFPVFTTEYEGVKRCSIKPQMTPQERIDLITKFLKYLDNIKYGDTSIELERNPLVKDRTVFAPPSLEFGGGSILKPFPDKIPVISSERFDSGVVRFGSKKISTLYSNGPFHNETLPNIVLLFPNTINRPIRETFLKDLNREINLLTGQTIKILQQRYYNIGREEITGSSLLRLIAEVKSRNLQIFALIILWNRFHKIVYSELKEAIRPMLSQCVNERTVRQICNRQNPQRARSQLRNLALAVITEAGVKPWVLAYPLHHDLYVGIDTLYDRVNYIFLYGIGGRMVETQVGHAIARSRTQEAIKKHELQERLTRVIRSIIDEGYQVNSIIIHRDGRWWQSESDGLNAALSQLKGENILPSDVRYAVVEIHKTHKPIRLFTATEDGIEVYFQNPIPGTYLSIDKYNVILTTTGRPSEWDTPGGRTARTMLLKVVEKNGDIIIEEIVEDTYRLSHLNWSSPDIEISLPVTIRWTDEALRETLRPPALEEEDGEEIEEYETEEDETYEEELYAEEI